MRLHFSAKLMVPAAAMCMPAIRTVAPSRLGR
jgi:hypothetical protein